MFPAMPGEDDELVNPGMYGKALAIHLQQRLMEKGYEVSFTCCEDWGWWVEISGHPFLFGVCVYCISHTRETQEYCVRVGTDAERRWSWKRFRMVDTGPAVEKLLFGLVGMLSKDPSLELLGMPSDLPEIRFQED